MFKTAFDPYLKRDARVRYEIAKTLCLNFSEVETLPWNEVLEIAEELGINTDYD